MHNTDLLWVATVEATRIETEGIVSLGMVVAELAEDGQAESELLNLGATQLVHGWFFAPAQM